MPFKRSQYFPKQLFIKFVLQQILGVIPALILAIIVARIYLQEKIKSSTSIDDTILHFERTLYILGALITFCVIGISLWTGYKLVFPLSRILMKARSLLKRDYSYSKSEDQEAEDGEWSDLESTLHRIGKNMQSQDLSLSQEREQIEAIISAITEAVVAVDKEGNILFYNSQFAVIFGQQKIERFSRLSDFIRNPDVLEAFRNTLFNGNPSNVSMHLSLNRQFSPRFFSLSLAPLKLHSQNIYGVVGVFHDITDLKHMDQVRIDFVANVSHELRTPLTSIKGYAQTLKDDLKESTQQKFLDTIIRNTDRLIALVQDLLNLSSLESGADLEMVDVDVHQLTERVVSQLESLREQKKQKLSTHFEIKNIHADPKRIEQVVFNLLENAIKYVPAEGNIDLRWEGNIHENRLIISDNGPGIPPDQQNRIFERFYRVDGARNREQGGTGLGLAIVKHIIQRHGGKVKVQSKHPHGSEFICTLPLRRP